MAEEESKSTNALPPKQVDLNSEADSLGENALGQADKGDVDKSKTKEEEKEKEKEPMALGEFTKYYMLPMSMFVVSILILFFGILPMVGNVTGTLGEISDTQGEYETLLQTRQRRERLANESNQQDADLAKINKLIPQSQTEVVDFSEDIRKKAESNSLALQSSVVREAVITNPDSIITTADGVDKGLDLAELPADFTLTGRFDNIKNFLGDIFGGDDFIIIKQMELRKQSLDQDANAQKFNTSGADNWFMAITLVKYQFRLKSNTTQADLQAAYFTVPEGVRSKQEVLDFINENY